ncbi:Yip5 [Kluyveromyces lactis]|nr:Yip5 [Kluyveromyces lactis]
MSAKKDLIDRDDDDINPFEDDSFVPQVTPGLKPFEPELQDVTLETTREAPQPAITTGKASIFSKLSPYFQVDETTLKQKLITALKLGELKSLKDPESQADAQLDLYSTVWITATVIMVLFLSYSGKSVIGSLITNSFSDVTDFQIMINCLFLFYIYVLGVPILAFLLCKFVFKEPFDVITAIDTYGVSNIVWVPIGFISVVTGLVGPFENIIEWVLVAIGGAYSGGIIYIQLKNIVTELQNGRILLLAMIGVHILFTFLVRWIIL